ncbi:MAG: diguanylate cyclase [Acidobacteria bacterium]|nr:diguanylate cyclase [Acidobacteriota bacterium]
MHSKITIAVLAFTTLASLFLVFLDIGLFEQTGDSNVIAETLTSSILQEERPILIHLPTGYDRDSDQRYPVIYVLDGSSRDYPTAEAAGVLARARVIPHAIVVGIPNTNRNRDLTPSSMLQDSDDPSEHGGGDAFLEFLEREMGRCHRFGRALSLIMFDIDHFKTINDRDGHIAGDYVLRELASVIKPRIRREECFARYGGEEFVVLVPRCDVRGLVQTAERIRTAIESLPPIAERRPLTVSIGGALYPSDGTAADQLFAAADRRLYQAKEGGRNRSVLPDESSSNVVPHVPVRRRKNSP